MSKEVEEIVSANSKEGENDGDNQSTEILLKKLIEINEKQNELLEINNTTSRNLNFVLFIIASLSFLSAFASTQIAAIQLESDGDPTGLLLFYFIFGFVVVLLFLFAGVNIWDNRKKVDETTIILEILALVFGGICIISIVLPGILAEINLTLISLVIEFSLLATLLIYRYICKNT